MSGSHRARASTLLILRAGVLNRASDMKRPKSLVMRKAKLRFPIVKTVAKSSDRKFKSGFKANRPSLFKS